MFEIGQQVKVLAFDLPAGLPAGDYTGTVRGVQEGHKIVFQVELDQEFGEAHDCDGAVPSGNGWNCYDYEIELLEEESK